MNFFPARVKPAALSDDRAIAVELVAPGDQAFSPWFNPNAPLLPGPVLAFRTKAHKDYDPSTAPGKRVTALHCDGALIFRRELIEPILATAIELGEVSLRQVRLSTVTAGNRPNLRRRFFEQDWVLLDVMARFPLDRATLERHHFAAKGSADKAAGAYDPDRPYSSLVSSRPASVEWPKDREPRGSIFRLHELPVDVFITESLLNALNEVLGDVLEIGAMRPVLSIIEKTSSGPAFTQNADDGAASAAAFFQLLADGETPARRRQAVAHPIYAYLVAKIIDDQPADDTRTGACGHPFYAACYARDIDAIGRDDTRQAASEAEWSALEYALYVDRGFHPTPRARLQQSFRFKDHERAILLACEAVKTAPDRRGAPPEQSAKKGAKQKKKTAGTKAGTARRFVPLLMPDRKFGDVSIIVQDAPEKMLSPHLRAPLNQITVLDPKGDKGQGLRKRIAKLNALGQCWIHPFVLRRSLVEPVLKDLGPDQLELCPVTLTDGLGAVDDDFVWLKVHAQVPLDRDASLASFVDPARPHASLITAVERFQFSPERSPEVSLFRVGEFPNVVMIEQGLLAKLRKATKNAVATVEDTHGHLPMRPAFALYSTGPKIAQSNANSRASAQAYYDLCAGSKSRKLRQLVLQNPIYAYWLALNVDGKAKKDTRDSALSHPHYAALYAHYVDGKARKDSRQAAATEAVSALFYVNYVDGKLHPITEKKLLSSGWGLADVELIRRDLKRVRECREA